MEETRGPLGRRPLGLLDVCGLPNTFLPLQSSSSHKAPDRRTSKKFKYDKGHVVKAELQKLVSRGDKATLPKAAPRAPCKDAAVEDSVVLPGSDTAVPAHQEAAALPHTSCQSASDTIPTKTEGGLSPLEPGASAAAEEADRSSGAPDGSATGETQTSLLLTDSSVFLDDDSNQPLPVSRFFGNVELMQVSAAPPTLVACRQLPVPELHAAHFCGSQVSGKGAAVTQDS